MKEYLLKYFDEDLINEVLSSNRYRNIMKLENKKGNAIKKVDIDVAKTLYEQYNLPMYKIAMLYGVSDGSIRKYLIKEKCFMKGHRCGSNSFNNYFETIDSPDKAYFLGLIFADGNIRTDSRGGGRKIMSIMLTESDKYILEIFNSYAGFNSNLIIHHKEDIKPRYGLMINSEKIYDDLVKLGVAPRKSKDGILDVPDLKQNLIPHFIRGYFDGDGIAKKEGYIGFCGDIKMIEYIKSTLINKCNVNDNTITYNKGNSIYYIQWSSKKDIKAIFDYIYKNKKDLYLKRKYQKIKNRPSIQ